MLNMAKEQTRAIMDLLLEDNLAMICMMDVLSQCTSILLPLNCPLDSQSHGDGIQLSPVDAHEPVLEAGIWELALTPVSLKVVPKPTSLASVKS